jgi:hypothetical protein|tara:strand:- start:93 stop:275 length:183 start_codon:yes stop_codon:yes gene_type:complete
MDIMTFSIKDLSEKNKDLLLEKLWTKYNHRREYMKNYMTKARAEGRIKHWRKYKNEDKRL